MSPGNGREKTWRRLFYHSDEEMTYLERLRARWQIWFHTTNPEVLVEDDKPDSFKDKIDRESEIVTRGGEDQSGKTSRVQKTKELADDNRSLIYENRQRLARVDERTAFIAKLVFGLFIAFLGATGAGLLVAFATSF